MRDLPYFVGASGTIGIYTLDVSTSDGNNADLCGNTPSLQQLIDEQGGESSVYATQELMGTHVGEMVVFEGDRFDSGTMTTSRDDAVDDDWFNLGCASHTLSKLLLTRNTFHSQRPGIARAWEQRQATLKMQVADYCGGGIPFTVAGQKLVWQGDLVEYISAASELEARWNENGAMCLNVPRLVHPTSPIGASTFPDVNLAIRSRCVAPLSPPPPPPCTNLDVADFDQADRVSANP